MNEEKKKIKGYLNFKVAPNEKRREKRVMDIEMIQFTGLLSIMLIIGWILIMIFFIVIGGSMSKTDEEKLQDDEEQMKYLKKYKDGGKKCARRNL